MTKPEFEAIIDEMLKIQRENCADAFMNCHLYKMKKGQIYHAIKQAEKPKVEIHGNNNK